MSKRTAILKRLMVATTVMTMTLGGSMTALAAEGGVCGCDDASTVIVVIDEQAATEAEKEILGNPDEAQTESETAIYEEYTSSDHREFAKEVSEEIAIGESFVDPESQKLATEYADDREEGGHRDPSQPRRRRRHGPSDFHPRGLDDLPSGTCGGARARMRAGPPAAASRPGENAGELPRHLLSRHPAGLGRARLRGRGRGDGLGYCKIIS